MQTVSRTLIEKLTFSRSAVTSLNWGSYPILTIPDVPEVLVDLIDRPKREAVGRGRADGLGRARRRSRTPSSTQPERGCAQCRSRPPR